MAALGDLLGPGWLLADRASVPSLRLGPITETRPFTRGSPLSLWTYQHDLSPLDLLSSDELVGLRVEGPVGDEDLVHLVRFAECTTLHLEGSRVTVAGLAALDGLTNLADLSLGGAPVGDEIGPVLTRFPKLAQLELGGTEVTDAIIPSLLGLPGLTRLGLRDTAVSGEGAVRLAELPSLRSLALPAGVRRRASRDLARRRPDLDLL